MAVASRLMFTELLGVVGNVDDEVDLLGGQFGMRVGPLHPDEVRQLVVLDPVAGSDLGKGAHRATLTANRSGGVRADGDPSGSQDY